jgi:hypothetical protein
VLGVVVLNVLVVTIVVIIHYEALYRLTRWLPKLHLPHHRYRIVMGVLGALFAHAVEIWIFAYAYYVQLQRNWGSFEGNFDGKFMDCVYFSFTSYTTLGFGDIAPMGDVRYLTGIEALTGLVLITWTASFLYLEMQKDWES